MTAALLLCASWAVAGDSAWLLLRDSKGKKLAETAFKLDLPDGAVWKNAAISLDDADEPDAGNARELALPSVEKLVKPGATVTLAVLAPGADEDIWSGEIIYDPEKKYALRFVFDEKRDVRLIIAFHNKKAAGGEAGDIVIAAKGARGENVKGAKVRLVLPGKDGALDKAPNILFEARDGGPNDADGASNGQVVFAYGQIKDYIKNSGRFSIEINAGRHVPVEKSKLKFAKDKVNYLEIKMTVIK